jgi:hypothetical protein
MTENREGEATAESEASFRSASARREPRPLKIPHAADPRLGLIKYDGKYQPLRRFPEPEHWLFDSDLGIRRNALRN